MERAGDGQPEFAQLAMAARYMDRIVRYRAMSVIAGTVAINTVMAVSGAGTVNFFRGAHFAVFVGAVVAGLVLGAFHVRRLRIHASAYAELEIGRATQPADGNDPHLIYSRLLLLDSMVLLALVVPFALLGFHGGLAPIIVCFLTAWLVWSWGSGSLLSQAKIRQER